MVAAAKEEEEGWINIDSGLRYLSDDSVHDKGDPIDHITILAPQNSLIDVFERLKDRRLADFKALNCEMFSQPVDQPTVFRDLENLMKEKKDFFGYLSSL